ncbi:MAG: hypothetical protein EAZ88_00135, partial [Oscillatoriales cyanobacterium]
KDLRFTCESAFLNIDRCFVFCDPGNNCLSSPVVRTDLSYFFFQHLAIVLASAAIGVGARLAVNLPPRF